jgi:hypothetical protein
MMRLNMMKTALIPILGVLFVSIIGCHVRSVQAQENCGGWLTTLTSTQVALNFGFTNFERRVTLANHLGLGSPVSSDQLETVKQYVERLNQEFDNFTKSENHQLSAETLTSWLKDANSLREQMDRSDIFKGVRLSKVRLPSGGIRAREVLSRFDEYWDDWELK